MKHAEHSTMKFTGLFWGLLIATSIFAANSETGSQETEAATVRYQGVPRGSSVQIHGTSNVHDWKVESKLIGGLMNVNGEFPVDLSVAAVPKLKNLPQVNVQILVRSIRSGKSTMDSVMHNAMKQKKHPKITYALTKMEPSKMKRKAGDPLRYDTEGNLTIAGVKKRIVMPVDLVGHGAGGLRITGKTKVKMTDFGIKPPAPKIAFGLIKTGDEVEIIFEWITKKIAPKP